MNYFLKVILIVLLSLMVIPRVVHASGQGAVLFYASLDGEEEIYQEILLDDGPTDDQARQLILALLENENGCYTYIPNETQLLDVQFESGCVTVDFSNHILDYGGSDYERLLVNQLRKTLFSLEEVCRFAVLVDGELTPLSEGSLLECEKREGGFEEKPG